MRLGIQYKGYEYCERITAIIVINMNHFIQIQLKEIEKNFKNSPCKENS